MRQGDAEDADEEVRSNRRAPSRGGARFFCSGDTLACAMLRSAAKRELLLNPEQPIRSMRNFIESTRDSIDHAVLDAAEHSMQGAATDADTWANWIRNFFVE